ncbi:iron-containing redox enzyme family protein [Cystobacter fuscus]|uniref:iron-containing redox enzyme family protein n=1 Tax=Cystobacter fuscus TaxID=43 RepID=UPI002B2EE3EA|nr:iron-containing redox enzyme family protein [Cystobacter fuscus]
MMERPTDSELLKACVARMGSRLEPEEESALRHWWVREHGHRSAFANALLARPESQWAAAIFQHPAARHPWYGRLAHEVSVREYATFLLENAAYPSFLPLVRRTLDLPLTDTARAAIVRNIEDEQVPIPHADLMRRLFLAVKAKASPELPLATYPSLVDRCLVLYYGYYLEPWNLIGSLFATEAIAHYRLEHMGKGLERLGFAAADMEFIRVHLACDDDHARDWGDNVIEESVRREPRVRMPIAEGIAAALETSAHYFDDLCLRATRPDFSFEVHP